MSGKWRDNPLHYCSLELLNADHTGMLVAVATAQRRILKGEWV
jgi:hypothetical protein